MVKAGNIVLIGFAEALSAPEVAWSLVDAGFQVAAFARKGRGSGLRHSRYVTIFEITPPETDSDLARRDLANVLQKCAEGIEPRLLFPLDDAAVWLCSRLSLPSGWKLAGPGRAAAELALDKVAQVAAARDAGFSVPPTSVVKNAEELLGCACSFPLMLKPARAVMVNGARLIKGNNWICADRCELETAIEQWTESYPLLVQPLISGTGEGVFGLATPKGVEAWSAHRRLRMMNPHGSGSSACASQPVSDSLRVPVETFIVKSGWIGLFMIELLRDRDGTAWFIEFNGRPWGSIALSRRQGFEYPAWAASLTMNPQWHLNGSAPKPKEIVCRNLARELMHLLFVLRGRKSAALKDWPRFWRSVADVLLISPQDALYNFRRDDFRVFISDCYFTIRDQTVKRRRRQLTR
jgi:predicted ATP-grasp superfamily ATP-dependent carboligase